MVYPKMKRVKLRFVLFIALFLFLFPFSCSRLFWNLTKAMRKPGEKMLTLPDKVAQQYECSQRKLPFFMVEKNEVVPVELKPGDEFNHHFSYVMCPAIPSQTIKATLYRKIYYQGRIVFQDVTENFEIKPGRWAVDAFITIPTNAPPGIYSLETEIISSLIQYKAVRSFAVLKRRKK